MQANRISLSTSLFLLFCAPVFAAPAIIYEDGNGNGQLDAGEEENTIVGLNGGSINTRTFDVPATANPDTPEIIIDFDYIDNSVSLTLNGTQLCAPSVCQLEQVHFIAGLHSFLEFSSGEYSDPWLSNSNGLPRLRVVINGTDVTLLGTPLISDTVLQPVLVTSGAINTPVISQGQNILTIANPDDGGPDAISATLSATYDDYVPSLAITKTADKTMNVGAGEVITYSYVVTNTGDAPIINVNFVDSHNGSGPAPVPANETLSADNGDVGDSTDGTPNDGVWGMLGPGDEITLTATYTVTQHDVDTLQ